MSISTIGWRVSLAACGMAIAFSAGAQTTVAPAGAAAAPFVDVALMGADVVLRSDRIRYRVTADPGSYVTLILISPRGHRAVLNPYEQRLAGTKRRELVRETQTGFESGESYLVAVATRSRVNSANLVWRSQATTQLASMHFSAEGSLDELLTSILPSAGNDLSVAYVSFRVLSRGMPLMLRYANRCPISSQLGANGAVNGALYRGQLTNSPFFDAYRDQDEYFDLFQQPYFASSCQDRLFVPPILIAASPAPVAPRVPVDTAVTAIDTVTPARTPKGPIIPDPVVPLPLNVEPFRDVIGRATTPMPVSRTPDLPPMQPVPEQEKREPVMPVPMAPRIDPVMPVQHEPLAQPPVPMEPRVTPTPLPPSTGTTPAIPPPG